MNALVLHPVTGKRRNEALRDRVEQPREANQLMEVEEEELEV